MMTLICLYRRKTGFGDDIKYASFPTQKHARTHVRTQTNKYSRIKVKYSVFHRMIYWSIKSRFMHFLAVNVMYRCGWFISGKMVRKFIRDTEMERGREGGGKGEGERRKEKGEGERGRWAESEI